jgi:tellurium resistance protein TerD
MGIDLVKGQRVDIGLQNVVVGLGWAPGFDLDLSAFMLGENKKLPSDEFFIFYKNTDSPDGAVVYSGDDRSGESSDGDDDESMTVKLDKVSPNVTEIIFVASIYDAHTTNQNFGQVRDSYIRIYDANNPSNVLCKYELNEDFSVESCVEFGRLYKRGSQWRFEAVGAGYRHNGSQPLQVLVDKYA